MKSQRQRGSESGSRSESRSRRVSALCCGSRPDLEQRPLLSFIEAVNVMALLKVLANDTRLRLLHHLIKRGEANVSDMANTLSMRQQAVSNQLARLSDTGIVSSRRDGNNIFYRIADRCVPLLLDQALCIMEDQNRLQGAGCCGQDDAAPAGRGATERGRESLAGGVLAKEKTLTRKRLPTPAASKTRDLSASAGQNQRRSK